MKFDDLMNDHSVKSIRKAVWADPKCHLELPPIIKHPHTGDEHRGAWCKLYGYDGNEEGTYHFTDIPAVVARDNEEDWEIHALYEPVNQSAPT